VAHAGVRYVPVLKWKQGEQFAVNPLSATQKALLLPLVEIQDRPYSWDKQKYTKSWERHIDDVVKATIKNWGKAHEIAVDQLIDDDDSLSALPGTPWEYLFESLWSSGVDAIPVVSRRASAAETAALLKIGKHHKKTRWLLRYGVPSDEPLPSANKVKAWFENAVAALGTAHARVSAVLDVAHVGEDNPKRSPPAVADLVTTIASVGPWRHLVLASGAFPKNLAGVAKGTKQLPRRDWQLFRQVRGDTKVAGLGLLYGDYGISHVEPFEGDPRKMVMSANLRYAHWDDWHVLKAKNVRDYGYDQYRDLCKLLVMLPIYMTASFSHGDASYNNVATNPSATPGNATTWRRDATNHHLHVVLDQLASLHAP
jgi:Beta protein